MTDSFASRLQGLAQNNPRVMQPSENVVDRRHLFAPQMHYPSAVDQVFYDQPNALASGRRGDIVRLSDKERMKATVRGGVPAGTAPLQLGLSTDPRDELLRQDIAEMLSGQPSLAERLASLFENLPNARAGNPAQSPFAQPHFVQR